MAAKRSISNPERKSKSSDELIEDMMQQRKLQQNALIKIMTSMEVSDKKHSKSMLPDKNKKPKK